MAATSGISNSERLENLIAHFEARTLPRQKWTHRAHLGLALWTLQHFSPNEALEYLRREIPAYNESIGVINGPFSGYHETMTQFYLRAVAAFLSQQNKTPETPDCEEVWEQLAQKWGDRNAIFAYYSRRYLFSPSTRAHFAPPDLRPLDF